MVIRGALVPSARGVCRQQHAIHHVDPQRHVNIGIDICSAVVPHPFGISAGRSLKEARKKKIKKRKSYFPGHFGKVTPHAASPTAQRGVAPHHSVARKNPRLEEAWARWGLARRKITKRRPLHDPKTATAPSSGPFSLVHVLQKKMRPRPPRATPRFVLLHAASRKWAPRGAGSLKCILQHHSQRMFRTRGGRGREAGFSALLRA